MKKYIIILLLLFRTIIAFSTEVDSRKAMNVAKNFYEHKAPESYTDFSIKNYYLLNYFDTLYADTVGLYIFNFNSGGWVVVASDDVSYPILSFAYKSELKQSELDNAITQIFEHYFKHISFKINCKYEDTQYLEIWRNLENHYFIGTRDFDTPVPSLLETYQTSRWAGWGPYFAGAPSDDGTNGCVPLAMSQIMKFWEYPNRPEGQVSYTANGNTYSINYDLEPDYNYSNMPYLLQNCGPVDGNWDWLYDTPPTVTSPEGLEIGRLQYHCGLAVHMYWQDKNPNYNSGTSGNTDDWAQAMVDHFGYSSNYEYITSYNNGSPDETFKEKLRNDLNKQHPILFWYPYHAFLIDGYQDDGFGNYDFFHFILGRGGADYGYYYLYDSDNDGIHQISPNHTNYSAVVNLVPYNNYTCGTGYDIHLNTNTIYDTDMNVPGNIIINPGAQLTVTAKLKFGDNKRIIVKRGAKLVLDGGHLTICDNATKWDGIIVEGNSNLPQPDYWEMPASDEAGIVVTKNNAKIENAHIGISTNYSGQWTDQKWGGVVHSEDTDFSGCWKGIEFMKYDLENKSYIGNCTFSRWKEGITIWATDGIEIENCSFDDQYLGVGFLDSKVFVQHDNSFTGCTRGILAMESIPGDSRLVVEDDNEFINNDTAIVLSGQNYSAIRNNNYFESNDVGVKISGYNQVDILNNFFVANNDNVTSDVTGNNYNVFSCNVMTGQDKGIWYLNENLKSEFLSNDFIGTYDVDVFGLDASIKGKVGSEYKAALNLFSDIDHDLYWADYLGNSEFTYYLPLEPISRTDPKYNGNFLKEFSSEQEENCIDIPPPVITTVILKKVIDDYCYWYYKYKENPNNREYKKKFLKYEKKLHSYYYYWKYSKNDKKTWKEIEDILKTICGHRWKVTLFGHYLSTGYFTKADSVLNVINTLIDKGSSIPEDMSNEQIGAFIEIQRINLKLHEINRYQISDFEKETLQSYALKNIPESAYAIGTYYLATGELISRPLPDYQERLEYRAKEYKKQEWLLYPNPTSNKLNIVYGGKNKHEGAIEMFDILGNMVLKTDYLLKRGRKKQIDVSNLKSGIYILNILDNNDKIIKTERVVIEFGK